MTQKAKPARRLAATTVCVLGALSLPGTVEARDDTIQLAASDSYWCRMFPKYCSDEGTPGGTQNMPDMAPDGAARSMEAARPEADVAPAKPATTGADKQPPSDTSKK
jgi:hypothetical protein